MRRALVLAGWALAAGAVWALCRAAAAGDRPIDVELESSPYFRRLGEPYFDDGLES